jgi:hypothetical protein
MKRAMFVVLGVALLNMTAGCGAIGTIIDVFEPSETTVSMVNNGDHPVEVLLYYDDEQDAPEDFIEEFGTERQFTVEAGTQESFTLSCEELQAVFIENAELNVVGEIGPEAATSVQRDGEEFNCGDTIIFTFDHSAVLTDFDIVVEVVSG